MAVHSGRALHFVFKVADRSLTTKFYLSVLGMKVSCWYLIKQYHEDHADLDRREFYSMLAYSCNLEVYY